VTAKSNKEKQADYRERKVKDGWVFKQVWIPAEKSVEFNKFVKSITGK
jgi:hypothetical protein